MADAERSKEALFALQESVLELETWANVSFDLAQGESAPSWPWLAIRHAERVRAALDLLQALELGRG